MRMREIIRHEQCCAARETEQESEKEREEIEKKKGMLEQEGDTEQSERQTEKEQLKRDNFNEGHTMRKNYFVVFI